MARMAAPAQMVSTTSARTVSGINGSTAGCAGAQGSAPMSPAMLEAGGRDAEPTLYGPRDMERERRTRDLLFSNALIASGAPSERQK
jgi:hypothetical protein